MPARPLNLDSAQLIVVTRLGGTIAGVGRALRALTGTFLRHGPMPGNSTTTGWSFRHPTLEEGFAAYLADDPNLIELLLAGQNWRTILSRIDCDTGNQRGTLLRVPPPLYLRVVEILQIAEYETQNDWLSQRIWHEFLTDRCSEKFLTLYTREEPEIVAHMAMFTSFLNVVDEPRLLARLKEANLVRPEDHQRIAERVKKLAVESPDAGWTWLPEWKVLLSEVEREQLLSHVKQQLPSRFDEILQNWHTNYNPEKTDPHTYYEELEIELNNYRKAFADDTDAVSAIDHALEKVSEEIWTAADEIAQQNPPVAAPHGHAALPNRAYGRNIFDDVDD